MIVSEDKQHNPNKAELFNIQITPSNNEQEEFYIESTDGEYLENFAVYGKNLRC
jgi:hypothetical protein